MRRFIVFFILLIPSLASAEVHCIFTPPPYWEIADPKMLSKRTLLGFLDKRKSGFCPSINLTTEAVDLPPQKYLEIVKKNCSRKQQQWRYLGKIQTKAGEADLTEIETKTKFGVARLLQMILIKDQVAYILTAGALKQEFGKHASSIETAFRSLNLYHDLFDAIEDSQKKEAFKEAWQKKKSQIESASYEKMVLEDSAHLGAVWQILMLKL